MKRLNLSPLRKPRTDDKRLLDIEIGIVGYMTVFIAHKLKLFACLGQGACTLADICQALHIAERPAEALLTLSISLDFVEKCGEFYALTPLAEDYLVEGSPTYFGDLLDFDLANPISLEGIEKALLTNSQQVYGGGDWVQSHQAQTDLAGKFTRIMHSYSMGAALAWPERVDLSKHQHMLDIGGGSGAHAIGAVLKWPHLQAINFDIAPVCEVAQEFIAQYDFGELIK